MKVDFFFGVGSRYSYLGAARIPVIEQQTRAIVNWRPVYSPDLIRRAGKDPFAPGAIRGQYDAKYRTFDASRWADFLNVPYMEPEFASVDWRRVTLWAVAAELLGAGAAFGSEILYVTFGMGASLQSDDEMIGIAGRVGLSAKKITCLMEQGEADLRHEQNIQDVLAAGGFGVPTFVVDDGEMFWGQDRVPLLIHHLLKRRQCDNF